MQTYGVTEMPYAAKLKSPGRGKASVATKPLAVGKPSASMELLVRRKSAGGAKLLGAGKASAKSPAVKGAEKAEISYIPVEEGLKTVERQFEALRPLGNLIDEKL